MRAHIFQHTNETPPGTVLDWFKSHGIPYSLTRFFKGDPLPDPTQVDWLVICGGGMGVHDTSQHPWLVEEKAFIAEAIRRNSTVLGLCLGAQLIADVCGATVRRHQHWEVGWHAVRFDDGSEIQAFQFHQDTFDIPKGARRFASGAACENQGYWLNEKVVGLQFHPEATAGWVELCAKEEPYPSGPFVQTPEQILARIDLVEPQTAWFENLLQKLESVSRR